MALKASNKTRAAECKAWKTKIAEVESKSLSDDQLTRIIGSIVVFLVVLVII